MKANITLGFFLLCLFPWLSTSAQAQNNSGAKSEKKIIITKRTTDAEGSEITETIVKKGQAAENFDTEKYIRENRSDKVQVEVREENSDIKWQNGKNTTNKNVDNWNNNWNNAVVWNTCDNTRAFLGVEEDSDEKASAEGLVVEVVRGSAAAKAGLKNNDKILKINDKPINKWDDLTKFIDNAKAGEKVNIVYERNGKQMKAEASLTTRKEVSCDPEDCRHGFLGVSPEDDDKDEPGVEVSITQNSGAEKAGLRDGDVITQLNDTEIFDFEDISDFMAETKPGDVVKISFERDGKKQSAEATLGEQSSWSWSKSNGNWENKMQGLDNWGERFGEKMENWGEKFGEDMEDLGERMGSWGERMGEKWEGRFEGENWSFDVMEKDACLGVYTDAYTMNDEGDKGAKIIDFTTESAAVEAQLQKGDVIVSVNGNTVNNHDDLWNEIAKYDPKDKVKVEYQRDGQVKLVEATLKACKDNSSQVIVNASKNGDNRSRQFTTWNWDQSDEKNLRDKRVITIHKGEGDAPKANIEARNTTDRKLAVQEFKAYPNPTQGQMTVEFRAERLPTIVSLYDLGGRQLFREELNAFDGSYYQQFDLSEYAKGTILIQVQQGDKIFVDRVVVN